MSNDKATISDAVELSRQLGSMADKRIDILKRIAEGGSISQAARSSGVSYKAAWQALETLGNLAGSPLVEKVTGGIHGGGTRLTATGERVLDLSIRLEAARAKVLAEFESGQNPELSGLSAASLRTSMRNHLPAIIERITHGPAMDRITLRIDEANCIKASVTKESTQLLQLTEGMRVLALTKATAVEIARSFDLRPRETVLTGTVIRNSRAAKGGEITLRLPGGLSIVGFARSGHTLGGTAQARIPASAVVIGLLS